MPVIFKYLLVAMWFWFGMWIGRGALIGSPARGGMVRTRPPLRSSWPLWVFVWFAIGFLVFGLVAPY